MPDLEVFHKLLSMRFLLNMAILFAVFGCKTPGTDSQTASTTSAEPSTLSQVHEIVSQRAKIGACQIAVTLEKDSGREKLAFDLKYLPSSSREFLLDLVFNKSWHVTNKVEIKKRWFSSEPYQIRLEKVILDEAPAHKYIIIMDLNQGQYVQKLRVWHYYGTSWNVERELDCHST